jgi:predicted Zn-dependent protease
MDETNKEILQNERDVKNNRACQLAQDGNYDDAIKIFNELLTISPKDLRALSNKATVVGKSGKYDEALVLFEQLITVDPHFLSCRICYINLLTYLGKYEQALKCYRQMPRPGGMTYMLLGSLSEDFKKLQTIQSKKGTKEETFKKMEKFRSKVKAGKPSENSPRFISLIWAGPPQV